MASSSDSQRLSADAKITKWWSLVCLLVGVALGLSQLLEIPVRSALRGYDNTFNYLWLRSAMVDGDWDFRNDLELANTLTPTYRDLALALPLTATGRIPNKYGVGWALISLPFYLVADVIVTAGRELQLWSYQNDGFNPVYQVCLQLGHVGVALLALWMAVQTISLWLGSREYALAGVITVWAASSLIYYQTANISMSHGAAFFAVTLLALATSRASTSSSGYRWWVLAGLGWGLAVIVRYQLVVFALPVVWAFWQLRRERRRWLGAVLGFASGALPLVLLQVFAWRAVYREWLVFTYRVEGESFGWIKPEILRSLFDPWHGLFYWHPYLLVGVAGMFLWAWKARGESVFWVSAFVAVAYVNSAWWCWWFASSFGNRGYDAALLPVMAGAGWLLQRSRGWTRVTLWMSACAFGLWNFYLVLLYRSGAISRNEPVTWREMIDAANRLQEATRF